MGATTWRKAAIAATVTGVLALAGCGVHEDAIAVQTSAHTGSRGAQVMRRAGEATSKVKSFRMSITEGMGGKSQLATGTAEVDLEHHREHMALSMGGSGMRGLSEEMIVDGTTVYMKLPAILPTGKSDKPWQKVTVAAAAKVQGSMGIGDSQGLLAYLGGVGDGVHYVGRERVRGVDTSHMKATVDLTKAMGRLPKSAKAKMQGVIDTDSMLKAFRKVPVEVWVSDDGYVRRLSVELDMLGALTGESSKAGTMPVMTETIELYDFDQPVNIQIPPPDQVSALKLPKFGN